MKNFTIFLILIQTLIFKNINNEYYDYSQDPPILISNGIPMIHTSLDKNKFEKIKKIRNKIILEEEKSNLLKNGEEKLIQNFEETNERNFSNIFNKENDKIYKNNYIPKNIDKIIFLNNFPKIDENLTNLKKQKKHLFKNFNQEKMFYNNVINNPNQNNMDYDLMNFFNKRKENKTLNFKNDEFPIINELEENLEKLENLEINEDSNSNFSYDEKEINNIIEKKFNLQKKNWEKGNYINYVKTPAYDNSMNFKIPLKLEDLNNIDKERKNEWLWSDKNDNLENKDNYNLKNKENYILENTENFNLKNKENFIIEKKFLKNKENFNFKNKEKFISPENLNLLFMKKKYENWKDKFNLKNVSDKELINAIEEIKNYTGN